MLMLIQLLIDGEREKHYEHPNVLKEQEAQLSRTHMIDTKQETIKLKFYEISSLIRSKMYEED